MGCYESSSSVSSGFPHRSSNPSSPSMGRKKKELREEIEGKLSPQLPAWRTLFAREPKIHLTQLRPRSDSPVSTRYPASQVSRTAAQLSPALASRGEYVTPIESQSPAVDASPNSAVDEPIWLRPGVPGNFPCVNSKWGQMVSGS